MCVFCFVLKIWVLFVMVSSFVGISYEKFLYAKETVPYQLQVLNVFLVLSKITIIQISTLCVCAWLWVYVVPTPIHLRI